MIDLLQQLFPECSSTALDRLIEAATRRGSVVQRQASTVYDVRDSMIDLLQQLFPECSPTALDRLIEAGGTDCPACSTWNDVALLIERRDASCCSCGGRLRLPQSEQTHVVAPPPRRFSSDPLGQPQDPTLPAPPAPGDGSLPERIGRYVLHEAVGHGGMGVVWRAYDPELQREVAVKVLHAGRDHLDRERFRREARIAASLDHPSIVRTLDVGAVGQELYIVQELVPGISLAERLEEWRPSPREAVELMLALADAMEHAHLAGVIHRDLKPGNVLIHGASGLPRITDFGLARRQDEQSNLSISGQLLGTPRYMAPEMIEGPAEPTPAADVYGLGTIFYELLAGRPPIDGETLQQILLHVSQGTIEPPRAFVPEIPPAVEAVCLACLSTDPRQRYESAGALARDLARLLDGEPISLLPPRLPVSGLAGKKLGPVLLERELGATAQGVLYEARCAGRGPALALVLRPPERFCDEREALAAHVERTAALSHPNLLPLQSVEQTAEGYTVLVHPHLAAIGLDQAVRQAGAFEQELALAITDQLLAALDTLHQQGWWHGQLRAGSVLLAQDGRRGSYVKLIESGLRVAGSPAADVQACAALLYQMLTGVSPLAGEEILPLSDVRQPYPYDRRLQHVLSRALSPDPARRLRSAAALAGALPRPVRPWAVVRALQNSPLWLLALYLLFGPLVVQQPDGRRRLQLHPGRQALLPGERVVARGILQWAVARPLPSIPPARPVPGLDRVELARFLPQCRTAGRGKTSIEGMVLLPASSEGPAFHADRQPVSREAYQRFLDAMGGAFPRPAGWAAPRGAERDQPVTGISWDEARLYALWSGKRLPDERQWLRAAPSAGARLWEWTADPHPAATDHRVVRRAAGDLTRDALVPAARRPDVGFRCVR